MGSLKKVLAVCAAGVLALTACSGSGSADSEGGSAPEVTLSVATFDPDNAALSKSMQKWMEEVEQHSNGRIGFEVFYNGSLCGTADMNDCVRDGITDIGFSSSGYAPADFPLAELGSLGFQSADMQGASDSLQQLYAETPEMQEEFAAVNQKLLFFSPAGAHAIALKEEISDLSDLKGQSIRATGAQSIALDELGANPVAVGLGEVFESIERGVLAGGSFSPELASKIRIFEVAPNFYDTGAYTGGIIQMMWTMNTTVWDSLDPDLQEAVDAATAAVQPVINEDFLIPGTEAACEIMLDAGSSFHAIGPESDGQAWAQAAKERLEQAWLDNAEGKVADPQQLLTRYQDLIELNDSGDHRTAAQICIELQG